MDIHHRRIAAAVAAVALLLAGCGGDDGGALPQTTPTTVAGDVVGDEIDNSSAVSVEGIADPGPGESLARFVDAARTKDLRAMWELMSAASRERAGPTYAAFVKRAGPDFLETVGGFAKGFDVGLSARTSAVTGLAAIEGQFVDTFTGVRGYDAFAAGAVKDGGEWRLEVLPDVALQLVSPDTQVASDRPVVVVNAEATAPIIDIGIWIDGRQYPSPADGSSPTKVNLLAQPDESIGSGSHTLVAYAGVAGVGVVVPVASAWTFSSP